jgi:hypothetical protein
LGEGREAWLGFEGLGKLGDVFEKLGEVGGLGEVG